MSKARNDRYAVLVERSIPVFPADTTLGWRVIRMVSVQVALGKLALGVWREVHDEHGNFQGCQVLATVKSDSELPSGASSTSITVNECELNAGLGGRSRTAGLPEDKRISRFRTTDHGILPLPPEDAIERAQAKVKEWTKPHSDKAVRVYPKSANGHSGGRL
jgi:hypothetical protein